MSRGIHDAFLDGGGAEIRGLPAPADLTARNEARRQSVVGFVGLRIKAAGMAVFNCNRSDGRLT